MPDLKVTADHLLSLGVEFSVNVGAENSLAGA
jgi:hypothetical protein